MALFFRYGVMNSSKTLQLLATAHNYESQGKNIICIKPSLDTRNSDIATRAGLSRKADIVIGEREDLLETFDIYMWDKNLYYENISCVLVDEANLLTKNQVIDLTILSDDFGIPVITYGLKTDFKGNQFEGSKYLINYADKIEEIKTICHEEKCNNKALFNMRMMNGLAVFDGEQIAIGDIHDAEFSYKPVCRKCFKERGWLRNES